MKHENKHDLGFSATIKTTGKVSMYFENAAGLFIFFFCARACHQEPETLASYTGYAEISNVCAEASEMACVYVHDCALVSEEGGNIAAYSNISFWDIWDSFLCTAGSGESPKFLTI